MHKKRFYQVSALVIFAFGIFFMINSQANITGAVIGVSVVFPEIEFFAGLFLMIFAGILVVVGRDGGLEVLISRRALDRAKKDPRIRHDVRRYVKEIEMIAHNPRDRPQEILGEFHVSPRGKSKGSVRIAWHLDGNKLYIDDLLYHVTDKKYVDDWAKKADRGNITIGYYENDGYDYYNGHI